MDNIFANLFRFKQREATPAPVGGVPGVPDSTMPKGGNVTGASFTASMFWALVIRAEHPSPFLEPGNILLTTKAIRLYRS